MLPQGDAAGALFIYFVAVTHTLFSVDPLVTATSQQQLSELRHLELQGWVVEVDFNREQSDAQLKLHEYSAAWPGFWAKRSPPWPGTGLLGVSSAAQLEVTTHKHPAANKSP